MKKHYLYILASVLLTVSYNIPFAVAATPEEIETRLNKLEQYYKEASEENNLYASKLEQYEKKLTQQYENQTKLMDEKNKYTEDIEASEIDEDSNQNQDNAEDLDNKSSDADAEDKPKNNIVVPEEAKQSNDDVDIFATDDKAKSHKEELMYKPVHRGFRKPSYVVPNGTKTPVTRKPFTQGTNDCDEAIVYAKVSSYDNMAFAKEEEEFYMGMTKDGFYVFPDVLAQFCKLSGDDALVDNNLTSCMNKVMKLLAASDADKKREGQELVNATMQDYLLQAYVMATDSQRKYSELEDKIFDMEKAAMKDNTQMDNTSSANASSREQAMIINRIAGSMALRNILYAFGALTSMPQLDTYYEGVEKSYATTKEGKA